MINNNNTGFLHSAFSIITSKHFTQYYPKQGWLALVTLPIAAMQGAETSILYSWVPIFPLGGERYSPG